jgi:hypothetical protein
MAVDAGGAALAAPALGQQVVSVEGAPFAMPPIIVPDLPMRPLPHHAFRRGGGGQGAQH